jgi:copper(I)-binding protein
MRHKLNLLSLSASLACAILLAGSACAFASVEVTHPMVKMAPTDNGMAAAYFTLKNTSKKDVSLTKVTTDIAKSAEIHESMKMNQKMEMKPIDKVAVKAGSETVFHPGGYHVMLIGMKPQLKAGQTVSLTLIFSDGEKKVIQAPLQGF